MDTIDEKIYRIGEFAKLTGVTERTLRYYDRQGLLKPYVRNAQGHRFYTDQDLLLLQKIITLKYLDFSLDDIAAYLQRPEGNLQESLAAQYEMLKRKQQQLNRVLGTMERMQRIVEGADSIDSNLLLMFIHNIQHEDSQKEWLAQQKMPSSFLEAVFMEGMSPEGRLEIERRMAVKLVQLKDSYKQGKDPNDQDVQEIGLQLVEVLQDIIGPVLSGLSEWELSQLEALNELEMPRVLFPTGLTKEEETFLLKVFEKQNVLGNYIGGEGHGDEHTEGK